MYKLRLVLFLVCGIVISSTAQHNNELYNDGALITIEPGAEVHVWGDVHMHQGTGTLDNNGLMIVQGNSYSDNLFQQRGTGIYRIENSGVNLGERQFISGSFAVRGGQAQIGVDDGSFYSLELANDQGIVYLVGTGDIADVRNSVNFTSGVVANTIVTHDIGMTGAIVYPANGSAYSGVFGLMNNSGGLANLIGNTVTANGNVSTVDQAYIIGKNRLSVDPSGGQYGFVLGLEPAGVGAQRGLQYNSINFQANNYDVITGYFESGSLNNAGSIVECTGETINYWGGVDHGEWVFEDIAGSGSGVYEMTVYPQDDNFIGSSVWVITKDNAISGLVNDCGPTAVGLSRSGLDGFSEFGVAAPISLLPIELIDIYALGVVDHINVSWNVASEFNLSHYELERSEDGQNFIYLQSIAALGNTSNSQSYTYDDFEVRNFQQYYYRVKSVDLDGSFEYTPLVMASIGENQAGFNENTVVVFPNPTLDDFSISLNLDKNREVSISVSNMLGQILYQESMDVKTGNTVKQINSQTWAPGVYNIELVDLLGGEIIIKRIIKN